MSPFGTYASYRFLHNNKMLAINAAGKWVDLLHVSSLPPPPQTLVIRPPPKTDCTPLKRTLPRQSKPSFPCPVRAEYECKNTFTSRAHARRHVATHSDKKSFGCECGKRYRRKDNLQQHRKDHHTRLSVSPCRYQKQNEDQHTATAATQLGRSKQVLDRVYLRKVVRENAGLPSNLGWVMNG